MPTPGAGPPGLPPPRPPRPPPRSPPPPRPEAAAPRSQLRHRDRADASAPSLSNERERVKVSRKGEGAAAAGERVGPTILSRSTPRRTSEGSLRSWDDGDDAHERFRAGARVVVRVQALRGRRKACERANARWPSRGDSRRLAARPRARVGRERALVAPRGPCRGGPRARRVSLRHRRRRRRVPARRASERPAPHPQALGPESDEEALQRRRRFDAPRTRGPARRGHASEQSARYARRGVSTRRGGDHLRRARHRERRRRGDAATFGVSEPRRHRRRRARGGRRARRGTNARVFYPEQTQGLPVQQQGVVFRSSERWNERQVGSGSVRGLPRGVAQETPREAPSATLHRRTTGREHHRDAARHHGRAVVPARRAPAPRSSRATF